jgi:hypothetical protein
LCRRRQQRVGCAHGLACTYRSTSAHGRSVTA